MEHPPASNPSQVHDELELTISPHSLTSFPVTPLANENDPFQSHTFMPQFNAFHMEDGMRSSGFHDLQIARNSVNTGGMHPATSDCNMHFMDNFMNQGGGFHTPAVDMNFLQRRGNVATELANSNSLNTSKAAICSNIGNMMPMLGHAQYRGIETNNDFLVRDSQSCTPGRMDGSFPTLETGGKIEKGLRNNYNAVDLISKLEGPSLIQQTISPSHIRRDSSSPNPFLFPMNATIANPHHSSGKNHGNSDVAVNTNKSMFMSMDIAEGVSGSRGLPSLAFCDTSSSHLASTKMPNIALGSSNPSFFLPNLMTAPLQSYSNSLKSMPAEPPMYPCIPKAGGGLIKQNHFGVGDTQTGGDNMLISSVQPVGMFHHDQSRRPAHFPTVPASGPSHGSAVSIHTNKKLSEPGSVPGGGIPTLKDNPFPQVSSIHGQPSIKRKSREPAPSRPRIKISHNPAALPVPTPRNPILTSSSPHPLPRLQMPRHPPLTSSPIPYLKWQVPNGPPKPTGHKCPLCKRDVAFSPDGPVHQPPIRPPVAVLPCGHVFHDHCLRLITPEDRSNDPPCIPCAIGDT